jgi:hypothetical protein
MQKYNNSDNVKKYQFILFFIFNQIRISRFLLPQAA